MGKVRQLVLFKPAQPGASKQTPLGDRAGVLKRLRDYNTAPDGSGDTSLAHGPGFILQFPLVDPRDDINQALISVVEDDIAWPVLSRLCKALGWSMMDPETGRTFGA